MPLTLTSSSAGHFVRVVDAESRSWVAVATVIIGDRDRAEEVVQEVLARLVGRWAKIEGLDRPGAFVRRAVINEAISVHRRQRRELVANERAAGRLDLRDSAPADPHVDLWSAVRRLPDDQMRAIALRHAADASLGEVADALGITEAAARTVLYRARKTLRAELSNQEVTR